jgi:hypothetical protein
MYHVIFACYDGFTSRKNFTEFSAWISQNKLDGAYRVGMIKLSDGLFNAEAVAHLRNAFANGGVLHLVASNPRLVISDLKKAVADAKLTKSVPVYDIELYWQGTSTGKQLQVKRSSTSLF